MKKNIKFIIFIIIATVALYFTKIKYEDHSLSKSILACVIAQKSKSSAPMLRSNLALINLIRPNQSYFI